MAAMITMKNILFDCPAVSNTEAIRRCGTMLVDAGYATPEYVDGMLARDRLFPTAIGNYIAIPHGGREYKHHVLHTGLVALVYPEGIKWDSEIVKLVIGIAAAGDEHIDILERVADAFTDARSVDSLIAAGDADALYAILAGGQAYSVGSPCAGRLIPLEQVDDPLFADKILGDGVALLPSENIIVSPVFGRIISLPETMHAVGIQADDGIELLIHVGIDTVNLKGKYFHSPLYEGSRVKPGDVLLEFDRTGIEEAGYDITTPILVTNVEDFSEITCAQTISVKPGDVLLIVK